MTPLNASQITNAASIPANRTEQAPFATVTASGSGSTSTSTSGAKEMEFDTRFAVLSFLSVFTFMLLK